VQNRTWIDNFLFKSDLVTSQAPSIKRRATGQSVLHRQDFYRKSFGAACGKQATRV